MPSAACLLAGLLAVTMLLWQKRVDFTGLAFFLAVYTLEFLVLAVVSDLHAAFGVWLALGLLLCLFLAWLWIRKAPARGLVWLLGLFAIFALLVPLFSLWQRVEQQNAIQFYVQGGLVLLLTGLWLVTRRKPACVAPVTAVAAQDAGAQEAAEETTGDEIEHA